MSFDIEKMKADGVSEHLIYLATVAPEVLMIRVARRLENDRMFQQFLSMEPSGGITKIYPYAVAAGLMSEADRLWLVNEENEYLEPYTITFNTDGGNEIEPMTVVIGQSITLPTPEKAEYIFDYWYEEETGVSVDDPYTPEGDITLKAHWTSNTISL